MKNEEKPINEKREKIKNKFFFIKKKERKKIKSKKKKEKKGKRKKSENFLKKNKINCIKFNWKKITPSDLLLFFF